MNRNILKALGLFILFGTVAFIIGIGISRKIAEFGLWIIPAFGHLYPLAIFSLVLIFSIITSRPILWIHLCLLLIIGILSECILFRLTKLFVFKSPEILAFFLFSQLMLVYGITLFLYFYFIFRIPFRKETKEE